MHEQGVTLLGIDNLPGLAADRVARAAPEGVPALRSGGPGPVRRRPRGLRRDVLHRAVRVDPVDQRVSGGRDRDAHVDPSARRPRGPVARVTRGWQSAGDSRLRTSGCDGPRVTRAERGASVRSGCQPAAVSTAPAGGGRGDDDGRRAARWTSQPLRRALAASTRASSTHEHQRAPGPRGPTPCSSPPASCSTRSPGRAATGSRSAAGSGRRGSGRRPRRRPRADAAGVSSEVGCHQGAAGRGWVVGVLVVRRSCVPRG